MIGSKLQSDPSKPEFFEGRVERLRVSNNVRYVLPFQPVNLKQTTRPWRCTTSPQGRETPSKT